MLEGVRQQLIAGGTHLSNAIRGDAAELGLTTARGLDKIEPLLAGIALDETVPALARELLAIQGQDYARLQIELKGQANGLASRQRLQPTPGADSRGRTDRRHGAGDEDPRSARVPFRPALCGLARAATERPFPRRQDQARQNQTRPPTRPPAPACGAGEARGRTTSSRPRAPTCP